VIAGVQGRCAVAEGHGVLAAVILGDDLLELGDPGSLGHEVGLQGFDHRSDVVLIDGLPAVGDVHFGHEIIPPVPRTEPCLV
jgi:hypothetical protein